MMQAARAFATRHQAVQTEWASLASPHVSMYELSICLMFFCRWYKRKRIVYSSIKFSRSR